MISKRTCKKMISFFMFFGAAFDLGRHEWFALRRLITNSRSSVLPGFFAIVFLSKLHTAEIRIWKWKVYTEAQELPNQRTNSNWPNDGWNSKRPNNSLMWLTTVTVLVFPLQQLLCWKFRKFLLRNIALVYLLTYVVQRPKRSQRGNKFVRVPCPDAPLKPVFPVRVRCAIMKWRIWD